MRFFDIKQLVLVDSDLDKALDIINGSSQLYDMFLKMPFPKSKKLVFQRLSNEIKSFSADISSKIELI